MDKEIAKKSIWKSIANAVSMITLPTGALTITATPMSWYGWLLVAIGLGVQIAKYYNSE